MLEARSFMDVNPEVMHVKEDRLSALTGCGWGQDSQHSRTPDRYLQGKSPGHIITITSIS